MACILEAALESRSASEYIIRRGVKAVGGGGGGRLSVAGSRPHLRPVIRLAGENE